MTDNPFGRQPQPVRVEFHGNPIDVETYLSKLRRIIENGSYDTTTTVGHILTIYPRAVND